MTREHFEEEFIPRFLEGLKQKISEKGGEYGPVRFDSTLNAMAAFEERHPRQECITSMLKHLKAIQLAPSKNHTDRIEDLIIFSLLLEALGETQHQVIGASGAALGAVLGGFNPEIGGTQPKRRNEA